MALKFTQMPQWKPMIGKQFKLSWKKLSQMGRSQTAYCWFLEDRFPMKITYIDTFFNEN